MLFCRKWAARAHGPRVRLRLDVCIHLRVPLCQLLCRHVSYASHLKTGDPLKFDRSTPVRQLDACLRVLDVKLGPDEGALTSARVIQDVKKCMQRHLLQIYEANGCAVPGIGNRNGKRALVVSGDMAGVSNADENWGGFREKGASPSAKWVHKDAVAARAAARTIARKQVLDQLKANASQ